MGRKRRDSKAFCFEQTEETLLQNENLVKLYQNKNFTLPDQVELETIFEENLQDQVCDQMRRNHM